MYLNNDNKALKEHEILGVNRKKLKFKSIPPKIPDQNDLHVKITKKNILRTIKSGCNPYDGILEDILCEGYFTYVDKSNESKSLHHFIKLSLIFQVKIHMNILNVLMILNDYD